MRVLLGAAAAVIGLITSATADTRLCDGRRSSTEAANLTMLQQFATRFQQAEQDAANALRATMDAEFQRVRLFCQAEARRASDPETFTQVCPPQQLALTHAQQIVDAAMRQDPVPSRAVIVLRVVNYAPFARFSVPTRQALAAVAIVNVIRPLSQSAARFDARLKIRDCASRLLDRYTTSFYWNGAGAPAVCAPPPATPSSPNPPTTSCLFSPMVARIAQINTSLARFRPSVAFHINENDLSALLNDLQPFVDQVAEALGMATRVNAVIGMFFDDLAAITAEVGPPGFLLIRFASPLAQHKEFAAIRQAHFQLHLDQINMGMRKIREARTLSADERHAKVVDGLGDVWSGFSWVGESIGTYRVESFTSQIISRELLQTASRSTTSGLITTRRDNALRDANVVLSGANNMAPLLP